MRRLLVVLLAVMTVGCYATRYEPRAPLVARSNQNAEVRFVSESYRWVFPLSSRREERFRLKAPTFTFLDVPSGQLCTVDGDRVVGEIAIEGDHEVVCTASVHGSGSDENRLGGHRGLALKRAGARRFQGVTVPLRDDPTSWRRVYPFSIGGGIAVTGTNDRRTTVSGAFPLMVGAMLGVTYVGFRVGPAWTTCAESECEPSSKGRVDGNGFNVGLDVRSYFLRTGRSGGFIGGAGARIEETATWLPTRTGITRLAWFTALATFNAGFGLRGWVHDPIMWIDGELGLGASIARDGGELRTGLVGSAALNFHYGF